MTPWGNPLQAYILSHNPVGKTIVGLHPKLPPNYLEGSTVLLLGPAHCDVHHTQVELAGHHLNGEVPAAEY